MSRWEYLKIDLNGLPRGMDDINLLNAAGKQGWELVGIAMNGLAYCKRKIEDLQPTPGAGGKRAS